MHIALAIIQRGHEFLVIRRKNPDGLLLWAFPGGKIEPGESTSAAAVREAREETGIICRPTKNLGERFHPDTLAQTTYWLCVFESQVHAHSSREVVEQTWHSGRDVLQRFTSDIFAPVKALLQDA